MDKIKLIIIDVDGTLTNGIIYYDNMGNETKAFHVKDGMAISVAIKSGIKVAIITGRRSKSVDIRAAELNISDIYQGISNKLEVAQEILKKYSLEKDEVFFIGDDINDIELMNYLTYSGCPADAVKEVLDIASLISKKNGGAGAVREIIEEIMKQQDLWPSNGKLGPYKQ